MNNYSETEKDAALEKLPKPIRDFLESKELPRIYLGLMKKLNLDLRQLMVVSELTHITLLGLEPESALETNIHQLLHELSNEQTRELVADINDRVFKEAKRRLKETIVTQEKPWNEKSFGPKDEFMRIAYGLPPPEPVVAPVTITKDAPSASSEMTKDTTKGATVPINITNDSRLPTTTSDKLTSTVINLPETSELVPLRQSGIQQVTKSAPLPASTPPSAVKTTSSPIPVAKDNPAPTAMPTPTTPMPISSAEVNTKILATPTPTPTAPPPRLKGDTDPYREAVE